MKKKITSEQTSEQLINKQTNKPTNKQHANQSNNDDRGCDVAGVIHAATRTKYIAAYSLSVILDLVLLVVEICGDMDFEVVLLRRMKTHKNEIMRIY
jgi:hypothetical protein